MATLTGATIASSYDKLLKFSSQDLTTSGASFNLIEDGDGVASSLELTNQATGKVRVRTKLAIGSSLDPSYQLDIGALASAIRVEAGGHTSLAVGNNHSHGFAAGDVNVAPGVGTGGAAQAYSAYLAVDPTAHSGKGQTLVMHGHAGGAIGIGKSTPAAGKIEIGNALHSVLFNPPTAVTSFQVGGNSEVQLNIDTSNKRIGLGESVVAPATTVEIAETGGAKADTNILSITNKYNAADMDGTGTGLAFRQTAYDGSTPTTYDCVGIYARTNDDWTHASSTTRTSKLGFKLSHKGSMQERVTIDSNGYVGVNTTNPNTQLHVVGNIKCTGTITSSSLATDFSIANYQLEDNFNHLVQLSAVATAPLTNADASHGDNDAIILARAKVNRNWELDGNNATSAHCTKARAGGIKLVTAGGSATDGIGIDPHVGTLNGFYETEWDTAKNAAMTLTFTTGSSVANTVYKIGLTTDTWRNAALGAVNDEAYFYAASSKASGTGPILGDHTKWHFVYCVAGVDYVTELDLDWTADTTYHFQLGFNASRQLSIFIDGDQHGLVNDFSTGAVRNYGDTNVDIDNAGGYGTNGSPVTITVKTTDATTKFVVGDRIMDVDGNAIGIITALTATTITLSSILHAVVDSESLYLYGAKAKDDTTDISKVMTHTANLKPVVRMLMDNDGTSTAKHYYIHKLKMERLIV